LQAGVAALQLFFRQAHVAHIAGDAQQARDLALFIAKRAFDGLENAHLALVRDVLLRCGRAVARQHPLVAGLAFGGAFGKEIGIGVAQNLCRGACKKAQGGIVAKKIAALQVLEVDDVRRIAQHRVEQARRVLPLAGAFLHLAFELGMQAADVGFALEPLADVARQREKPFFPAHQQAGNLHFHRHDGAIAAAVLVDADGGTAGLYAVP
jgi:hypothetical protein